MVDILALTVALGSGAVTGAALNAWNNRDITKLKDTWKKTLLRCHTQGIRIKEENGQLKTFILIDVKRNENGYTAKSLVPIGLDYEALINAKRTLESNLNATIEIDKDKYCKWININIVCKRPEIKFRKIECDSNMFFGGYKLNGKANLIDLDCDSHIVILGRTRTGKSVAMFMGLTNLFANAKKYNNFKVYFLQTKKRDLCMFENCKNVQKVGKTLSDCENILKLIMKELEVRADLVEKHSCKDINEYNNLNPKKRIPRLIIVGEEFSFFKEDDADSKVDKELKASCEKMILEIVKTGGGYNVNLISALQRPTSDNLNVTVRSQLSVITFKLKSENDSKIAIQDKGAEKLNVKEREAIWDGNTGTENIIYPKLSRDFKELRDIVPAIKKPVAIVDAPNIPINNNNSVLSYEETQELKNRAKKEHLHVNEEYKKLQDNKVVSDDNATNGLYDKQIFKFIEVFGGITIKQCSQMFYHNKNNAGRRLKDLENKGKLKSYVYSDKGKEKVYVDANDTRKITYHEILINNFYSQLVEEGAEILEVNRHPHILQDKRRPDLYVRYTHNNHEEKVYLEVDYTHFTDDIKIFDYDALWKKTKDFKLIVMRDGKFITKYTGEMEINHIQTKKYSIFNA